MRRSFAIPAAAAVMASLLVVAPASADHPTSAVTPTAVEGNPACSDVIPGAFDLDVKIEPVADGVYPFSNSVSGTVTVDVDEGEQTFDFSIDGAVAVGVLVKGGPNANFYDYRPGGTTSDVDLHAPNRNPVKWFGLSHISFCLAPPGTGAIEIDKDAKHAGEGGPNLEATFEIVDSAGAVHIVTTDASGFGCVDGLALGTTQSITETVVPAGYSPPAIPNVEVTTGDCESTAGPPVLVPVENVPLTDLQVLVQSQHPGATASNIVCDGHDSGGFTDPAQLMVQDLPPGTYTCTIIIDP